MNGWIICIFMSFATEHVNSLISVITRNGGGGVRQEGLEGSKPYSDLRLSIIIFMEIFRCLDIHNSINGSQNLDEK